MIRRTLLRVLVCIMKANSKRTLQKDNLWRGLERRSIRNGSKLEIMAHICPNVCVVMYHGTFFGMLYLGIVSSGTSFFSIQSTVSRFSS